MFAEGLLRIHFYILFVNKIDGRRFKQGNGYLLRYVLKYSTIMWTSPLPSGFNGSHLSIFG